MKTKFLWLAAVFQLAWIYRFPVRTPDSVEHRRHPVVLGFSLKEKWVYISTNQFEGAFCSHRQKLNSSTILRTIKLLLLLHSGHLEHICNDDTETWETGGTWTPSEKSSLLSSLKEIHLPRLFVTVRKTNRYLRKKITGKIIRGTNLLACQIEGYLKTYKFQEWQKRHTISLAWRMETECQ